MHDRAVIPTDPTPTPTPTTPRPSQTPSSKATQAVSPNGTWLHDGQGWRWIAADGSFAADVVGTVKGGLYAFDRTGHVARGWYQDGSGRWYQSTDNGVRKGWQAVAGCWYYLDAGGVMRTGWIASRGRWYLLGPTGAMATGWALDRGNWYYLDPAAGGSMATAWRNVEGQRSYFDPWDGFWVTSRASFQRDWDRAATQHSSSNYLLTVDTAAPHCMAFYWRGGAWQPLYDHPCSVGAPGTPTIKGNFRIGNRGYSFGRGYTVYWWTQFYGDYLFHSVLYNQGTLQVQDGRLGRHLSHGCVRMRYQDAKWIYDNVPRGTTVLVY